MPTTPSASNRINSIDILRGVVMVVMALDHVRDFFSGFRYEPTDMQHTTMLLFFTRWITHFCAPTFVFLSGTSAFLSMGKGKTLQEQSRQLLMRGLWLIVLELTVVRLGWTFNMDYHIIYLQVIWAIGVSMVALSALIFLPRPLILFTGLAMILGHDLLDGAHPQAIAGLWDFLHVQGPVAVGHGVSVFVIYPLIPWIGVMAVGFCFGEIYREKKRRRHRWLYLIGTTAMAWFVLLRFINMYGDPEPWHSQPQWWHTMLSFLNCSKYPPSLLYLLMTLGPAITLLAVLEVGERREERRLERRKRAKARAESERAESGRKSDHAGSGGSESAWARFFIVYGRVPMFYYILHIYLIHGLSLAVGYLYKGNMVKGFFDHPGFRLPVVYGVWIVVVLLLYFPCRWFMRVKQNYRWWWLSYV